MTQAVTTPTPLYRGRPLSLRLILVVAGLVVAVALIVAITIGASSTTSGGEPTPTRLLPTAETNPIPIVPSDAYGDGFGTGRQVTRETPMPTDTCRAHQPC
jgi:hypothetical protein